MRKLKISVFQGIKFRKAKGILLFIALFFSSYAQAQQDDCDTLENLMDETSVDTVIQSITQPADPFRNHVLKFDIQQRQNERQPLWLFMVFVAQFFLIAYLRVSYPKGFEDLINAVMNLNIANQMYREQEQSMPVSAILYNINFVLAGGVFLFLLNRNMEWMKDDTFVSMLFFLWAVIVIYSLRYGILKAVALVFPFTSVIEHYNFNFFLIQKLMGLALMPLNLLMAYGPDFLRLPSLISAVSVICVLVIGRSLKGLTIAGNLINRHAFHFFVYICTLEIAPVCILVKVVVDG